MLGSEISLG